MDLPLISALCNDRSLIKQTKVREFFVLIGHLYAVQSDSENL